MKLFLFSLCASFVIASCIGAVVDYSNIAPWPVNYRVAPVHGVEELSQDWNDQKIVENNKIGWGWGNQQRQDSNGPYNAWDNNSQWDRRNNNRVEQLISANQHITVNGQPWSSHKSWPKHEKITQN
ncbi:hypothetical protein TKK_0009591 [Trichogramma kaykai]|uniref:Secreted protein n=1 Tax=Trichogramma kaykai TaxID=54128 RepID=A0ABD2X188_9HYME